VPVEEAASEVLRSVKDYGDDESDRDPGVPDENVLGEQRAREQRSHQERR
jgi:hypothetical protein